MSTLPRGVSGQDKAVTMNKSRRDERMPKSSTQRVKPVLIESLIQGFVLDSSSLHSERWMRVWTRPNPKPQTPGDQACLVVWTFRVRTSFAAAIIQQRFGTSGQLQAEDPAKRERSTFFGAELFRPFWEPCGRGIRLGPRTWLPLNPGMCIGALSKP